MIVYKFGGTSVADAQRIRVAAGLVGDCEGERVVVVSALGGVTNDLVQLSKDAREGNGTQVGTGIVGLRTRHGEVARDLLSDTAELGALEGRLHTILSRLERTLQEPPPEGEADLSLRFEDAVSATGEDLSAQLMAARTDVEAGHRPGTPGIRSGHGEWRNHHSWTWRF